MRKSTFVLGLVLFLAPLTLLAQSYPKESYQIDEGKKTLVKWTGSEETIDLSKDPTFALIETIGDAAFKANRDLQKIILPPLCKQINTGAFADCNNLREISWDEKLESIGEESFFACKSLENVDLKKVQRIEGSAFSGCAKLKSILLPKTLEELGAYAFYNCRQLSDIEVEKGNETYFSIGGVLYSYLFDKWYLEQYPRGKSSEEFVIPFSTIGTAPRAFDNCKSLKRLYIPGELSRFNENAFFNCTGLEEIYSYRAFPPEVMGEDALNGVNVAQCKLYVPEDAIAQYQAADGWKLFKNIEALPEESGISKMSYIYDHTSNTLIRFIGAEESLDMTKDPTLSKTVYIADGAIGGEKLSNQTLRNLVLAEGVKEIGEGGIWATELTSITLNRQLEVMHEAAISGAKITELVLPSTLNTFYPCGIYNAFKLRDIRFDGENSKYVIKDGLLIEKESNALLFIPNGWNGGRNISLPAGITAIADRAVYNNIILEELLIGEGVQVVGTSALSQCITLTYVDLPASVTTIKNNAFKGDNVLETVIIRSITPPEASPKGEIGSYQTEGSFDQLPENATLYVPQESLELYKANAVYSESFRQIKPLEEAPAPTSCKEISAPLVKISTMGNRLCIDAEGKISLYNLSGALLSSATNHLLFEGTAGDILLVVVEKDSLRTIRKVILR